MRTKQQKEAIYRRKCKKANQNVFPVRFYTFRCELIAPHYAYT